MTRLPRSILLRDVLKPLLGEPSSGSNEPVLELSIASAQLESHGAKLDRITRQLSHGTSPAPSESSATGLTV